MADTQLPGVFWDLQPLLEHCGYLAVGGFVVVHLVVHPLVERVCTWAGLGYLAGENIVQIYAAFERYKWYVIAAIVLIAAILVTRRVGRTRPGRRLVRL